jgi:hypothetical protein
VRKLSPPKERAVVRGKGKGGRLPLFYDPEMALRAVAGSAVNLLAIRDFDFLCTS